jgi:hypothetical protein
VQCGAAPPGSISVNTIPAGIVVNVDSLAQYITPFTLTDGLSHYIAVASSQTRSTDGPGVQYQFASWSDAGANGHTIQPGANVTANFNTYYQFTGTANPLGSGSIVTGSLNAQGVVSAPFSSLPGTCLSGGWCPAGTSFWVTGQASSGYSFIDLGNGLRQQDIVMNGPTTITANFSNNILTASTTSNLTVVAGSSLTAHYSSTGQYGNGGYVNSSSLSNGSCTTLTGYILGLIGSVNGGPPNISFDVSFLAGGQVPAGTYDVTCTCAYYGCIVEVGPVTVEPAPTVTISKDGSVVGSSAGGVTCTSCEVSVGQQITLTGSPAGGTWDIPGTTYTSWQGTVGNSPSGAAYPVGPAGSVNINSASVSFFWTTSAPYVVHYTYNGVAAPVTFTVDAPDVSCCSGNYGGNTGLPGFLTSQAQMVATVTPSAFTGTTTWIQVIPSAIIFYTGSSGTIACSPIQPGPAWLDGSNPYPIQYPINLPSGQFGYFDSPNVNLALAQQQGITAVSRQISFNAYVMWQPQVSGISFQVPFFVGSWTLNDWANFTNNTWTTGGNVTGGPGGPAVSISNSPPTWSGTAAQPPSMACTPLGG